MRHSNSHKFPAARRIKNIEPVANCYSQWIKKKVNPTIKKMQDNHTDDSIDF